MSNPIDLFPPRIHIADATGMMTPEFYRALQAVFRRIGGASSSDMPQSVPDEILANINSQDQLLEFIMQPINDLAQSMPDVITTSSKDEVIAIEPVQVVFIDNPFASETTYA